MRQSDSAKAFLLLVVVPLALGTAFGLVVTVLLAANLMSFGGLIRSSRSIALACGGVAGLAISYLFFRQLGIQFIARKLLPQAPWPSHPGLTDRPEVATNLRVEFRLGVWDIVKFNLTQHFLSPLIGGVVLGLVVFIFICEVDNGHSLSGAAFTALQYFIGLWLAQAIITSAFLYKGSADSVLTDHVLEIREGGIFERTPFNESLYFWPSVVRVARGPGYVAVFISARQAHVIPTRAFDSKERLARFVASLREKKGTVAPSVNREN